jgi:hypothetical protein
MKYSKLHKYNSRTRFGSEPVYYGQVSLKDTKCLVLFAAPQLLESITCRRVSFKRLKFVESDHLYFLLLPLMSNPSGKLVSSSCRIDLRHLCSGSYDAIENYFWGNTSRGLSDARGSRCVDLSCKFLQIPPLNFILSGFANSPCRLFE